MIRISSISGYAVVTHYLQNKNGTYQTLQMLNKQLVHQKEKENFIGKKSNTVGLLTHDEHMDKAIHS